MSYHNILKNIAACATRCGRDPTRIHMVAVSKGASKGQISALYQNGVRDFGENRVKEILDKSSNLPLDIHWHFIGRLQSNKVAPLLNQVNIDSLLIHSVDSLDLVQRLSLEGEKRKRKLAILLQVNTSGEKSKQGMAPEEWENSFGDLVSLKGIEVQGLMTIGPHTEDKNWIRDSFRKLRECFFRWKEWINNKDQFTHLSMGMSGDYEIAIEEGATLLRIGTAIFPLDLHREASTDG